MQRSLCLLKDGCKTLRSIIRAVVPEGEAREDALAMVRSAWLTGRDEIIAADDGEFDRAVDAFEVEAGPPIAVWWDWSPNS